MALDLETGIELIKKAYEQRNEDMLMQRWIMHYQAEMSFDEFKARLGVAKEAKNNKTEEEILKEVKEIIDSFREVKDIGAV